MAITCKELLEKEYSDRFQNGDIIQFTDVDNTAYYGVVISKRNKNLINMLMLGNPRIAKYTNYWLFNGVGDHQLIKLYSVMQEIILALREGIEILYPHKYFDNLTYIEILARLKEYERTESQ